jgi:GDP/UDP-N,N'-diacetylbacillosamine 2-epimerase (hydrolysing)
MKKIAVITGSRSEYGLLKPLLDEIKKSDVLTLQLIVTGTHLLPEYGNTVQDIVRDHFSIDASVPMYIFSDSPDAYGHSIGHAVAKLTSAIDTLKSDLVLVLGDRAEAFAGAVAAMSLNIPIAHLSGGEVTESGHVDEQMRHAITKMGHIHFPATSISAGRIAKMGEESWRIFLVGDPGISAIHEFSYPSKKVVCDRLSFDAEKPLILCVQHPVSYQAGESGKQMRETLAALTTLGIQTVIIYPNGDHGSRDIVREIQTVREMPFFRVFLSLPREEYLGIMKNADVMVGNSSSGIAEAPSFGLLVVNIGDRERSRENVGNIIHVPHDRNAILSALKQALHQRNSSVPEYSNPYAGKNTAKEIVTILEHLDIDSRLIIKKMTY